MFFDRIKLSEFREKPQSLTQTLSLRFVQEAQMGKLIWAFSLGVAMSHSATAGIFMRHIYFYMWVYFSA